MSSIRGTNTSPELAIRKALHARGLRYRVNVRALPGTPDIVFRRLNAVIFINGCFWHSHDCSLFRKPATRQAFWEEKLRRNHERDLRVRDALCEDGWRCLTVWECSIRGPDRLKFEDLIEDIEHWLGGNQEETEFRGNKRPYNEQEAH